MSELVTRAHNYVADNAAESGADALIVELADRIVVLEAALRDVIADIKRFGRVNHLYEESVEIVARASAALDDGDV